MEQYLDFMGIFEKYINCMDIFKDGVRKMTIDFSTYRKGDIDKNLERMAIAPLDVMVTGVTGAGKSTTLNAFFQKNVAKVGTGVDPETMEVGDYSLNDSFRIWDTPGLGDGIVMDELHKRKMTNLLCKTYVKDDKRYGFIDMVMVVIEGANRDMGSTYTLLNEVIIPNIQPDRILVMINQADMAMKGRHWNHITQTPDAQLLSFLEQQAHSIQDRIYEATGIKIMKPIYYSAAYKWNVQAVMDCVIDHMPTQRRTLSTL